MYLLGKVPPIYWTLGQATPKIEILYEIVAAIIRGLYSIINW